MIFRWFVATCAAAVEDEDELGALIGRVPLPAGTELHRVASTEARRLKRIPPQSERVMDYVITGLWPTTRRSALHT